VSKIRGWLAVGCCLAEVAAAANVRRIVVVVVVVAVPINEVVAEAFVARIDINDTNGTDVRDTARATTRPVRMII
jgi:hypothetical protein